MKFPDLFYIKQTRILNNLHAFSVELLAKLYSHDNPLDAYNSEWGDRQIGNLTASIQTAQDVLGKERAGRILRRRIPPPGFTQRAELDRDVLKMEILQGNIEQELEQLSLRKSALIGWLQAGLLLAILALLSFKLNG